MLLVTDKRAEQCAMWADLTPNEYYQQNADYRNLIRNWAKHNDIPKWSKCFEVRLVNQKSRLSIEQSSRWWDQPEFMDKRFWVYARPVKLFPDGPEKEPLACYALEFHECQRVKDVAVAKLGYNPFFEYGPDGHAQVNEAPSLLVPVDCCEIAWEDTKAGFATNIRERAIERAYKSPEQLQHEADVDGAVKENMKNLVEITGNEFEARNGDIKKII